MSYTSSPTTENYKQPAPKDNRKAIYGVLIAALVLTWGYIIYDKSKASQEYNNLQAQYTNVDSARTALQSEFSMASSRLDQMTIDSAKLSGAVADKNNEIQKLKGEISSILNKKNATAKELANAKKLINELNTKTEELYAQIEQLKGENTQLTASNQQLSTEKEQLTTEKTALNENLTKTQAEKDNLENVASTLHASNIAIAAIDVKGSGKEKETSTAKRADLMRVSFQLDENRISTTGTKELYVSVVGPDGKPITKGESFTTKEEGDKQYTSKVSVNYEQGKRIPVSFDWKQDGMKYQQGNYKVEIYHNGYKIGEGTKTLKKGGLFS